MKDISTLPEDIYDVLTNDKDLRHTDDEVGAEFSTRILNHYHRAVNYENKQRKDKVLYASEIGKPCTRAVWYSHYRKEEAEPIGGAARYKFLFGDVIEEITLELAEAAGHTVEGQQAMFEMPAPNGWTVRGRQDCTIDGVTVDVKSASRFAFNNYTQKGLNDATDKFGYRSQLKFYTDAAMMDGTVDTDEAYLLMVGKELGHISLVPQDPTFTSGKLSSLIDEKVEALDNTETPPDRSFGAVADGKSGNMKLGTECGYCAFKHTCWPELRTYIYSNGPRFLTHVAKEPNVPEKT